MYSCGMDSLIKNASIITFIVLITGCTYTSVYDKVYIVEEGNWFYSDTIEFSFEANDTESPCDFYLIVRNNNDYHYNNFIAFVELYFPNGKMRRDTVQMQLATSSGKWLGSGIGDVYTNEQLFIAGNKLPMSGTYTLKIIHAMRDELLLGINDVGVSVRKNAK